MLGVREIGMRQPPEIIPRYLRISQAATYMGLAVKTLYRLAEEKRIPHIKKGRTIFFDRLALDKWMEQGTVKPLAVWGNGANGVFSDHPKEP